MPVDVRQLHDHREFQRGRVKALGCERRVVDLRIEEFPEAAIRGRPANARAGDKVHFDGDAEFLGFQVRVEVGDGGFVQQVHGPEKRDDGFFAAAHPDVDIARLASLRIRVEHRVGLALEDGGRAALCGKEFREFLCGGIHLRVKTADGLGAERPLEQEFARGRAAQFLDSVENDSQQALAGGQGEDARPFGIVDLRRVGGLT